MIRFILTPIRSKFSPEVFAIRPYQNLIRSIRIIHETVIKIVVDNACSGAKRYLSLEIREKVYAIVMMMLDNCQFGMKHHPMNEIGKLTKTPANPS